MNVNTRKLKMNITGSFHLLWTLFVFKRKAKELGLTIDEIKHNNVHHTEIVLSGESEQLWKALNLAKTPSYLLKMDRIKFEFSD
jgi:hypothetical protein